MRRVFLLLFSLALICALLFGISTSAYAYELTGYECIDNFINDPRFTKGVSWGSSQRPIIAGYKNLSGCLAYVADYAKYCYGLDDPRDGEKFTNIYDIRDGDVIHVEGHWFVCLKRTGNEIYIAEGNYNSKVVIGRTQTIVNSTTLEGKYDIDTFVYGYHYPLEEQLPESGFTDVTSGSWYYDNVKFVVDRGLFNGVGNNKFQPNGTMTREMFVTVLYRLAGEPAVSGNAGFTDVTNTESWYYKAVAWAKDKDITSGISATEFGVGCGLKRQDMITLMYRYAQKNGLVSGSPSEDALDSFDDAGKVSSYAKESMCWAVEQGIITGMSGKNTAGNTVVMLQPFGVSTRAQVAAVIQRMVQ